MKRDMRSSGYFDTQEKHDELELGAKMEGSPLKKQISKVIDVLTNQKLMASSRISGEVFWFYFKLGIEPTYFNTSAPEIIARDILSLYAAKTVSFATGNKLSVHLHSRTEGNVTFITPSSPGSRDSPAMSAERYIEKTYLLAGDRPLVEPSPLAADFLFSSTDEGPVGSSYRMSCFRTAGTISSDSHTQLRMYFLNAPSYPTKPTGDQFRDISDIQFWEVSSEATKKLYREIVYAAADSQAPVIKIIANEKNTRLVVAYRKGSTHSFWTAISDLYHFYNLYSQRKYVEQFANGTTVFSIYLKNLETSANKHINPRDIGSEVSMCYVLPRTSLTPIFQARELNGQEVAYAYVVTKFAFQFLNRYSTEYSAIANAVSKDSSAQAMLALLKSRLAKDTFTENRVREAIGAHTALIKELFQHFATHHSNLGSKPLTLGTTFKEQFLKRLQRSVANELDVQIFTAILTFNEHLLKTNFFTQTKVALSFRLDPKFLSTTEYPETPFAVFFVVGSEFRGFHIRFRDIARGGIRIIRSQNSTNYDHNSASLFDENYGLASTQQHKNKDIPEGGSKGTILLNLAHQGTAEVAFRKYVDAILDLILPSDIVDYYNTQEILFFGPDEGTADFMGWASQHAKKRGYAYWKAFTTGKSMQLGGIPHDLYGMTTRSIHQYVLGTLSKMNLDEEKCTKFMTGGPDGDLGSNEIKISKDKTIGIVDGSGVLYDPAGIDRKELLRLANKRAMCVEFDKARLGPQGFFVEIGATNIQLPDGTQVDSGLVFRNNFHLNPLSSADIFVPCGGRPESVQLTNIDKMYLANTQEPRFKIIVEGANLFFSQKARLQLEKRGATIYKDSSANKGGVTSSSLEVFAALALTDEEFDKYMVTTKDGVPPPFYQQYIADVHEIIEENAKLEFECIWREHLRTKSPRCELTDDLSHKINELNDSIQTSPLWDNVKLRETVLSEACPKTLLKTIGFATIFKRVPERYMKAIFGSYIASRFVYTCGLQSPEFAFFTFITQQKYFAV